MTLALLINRLTSRRNPALLALLSLLILTNMLLSACRLDTQDSETLLHSPRNASLDYPFLVRISPFKESGNTEPACVGSLIAPRIVLTHGACFDFAERRMGGSNETRLQQKNLGYVWFGPTSASQMVQVSAWLSELPLPKPDPNYQSVFTWKKLDKSVALAILAKPFSDGPKPYTPSMPAFYPRLSKSLPSHNKEQGFEVDAVAATDNFFVLSTKPQDSSMPALATTAIAHTMTNVTNEDKDSQKLLLKNIDWLGMTEYFQNRRSAPVYLTFPGQLIVRPQGAETGQPLAKFPSDGRDSNFIGGDAGGPIVVADSDERTSIVALIAANFDYPNDRRKSVTLASRIDPVVCYIANKIAAYGGFVPGQIGHSLSRSKENESKAAVEHYCK